MLLDETSQTPLVKIREFKDRESLVELCALMESAGIPYSVYDSSAHFDATFSFDQSRRTFHLLVPESFAGRARQLCVEAETAILEQLPGDYYLFGFSNDELKNVVIHSPEWSPLDVLLAQKLLAQRGIDPETEGLKEQEAALIRAGDAPETMKTYSLVFGYLFCAIGSLIGIIFIIYLFTAKKTTHDGLTIGRYDAATKRHGYYMILVMLVLNLAFGFYYLTIGLFQY